MKLSTEESLGRMNDFERRRDQFIDTIRGHGVAINDAKNFKTMSITIEISRQTENRLRQRATLRGEDFDSLIRGILNNSAKPLVESAAPLHEAFLRSGMTQQDLDNLADELILEVRAEKPLRNRWSIGI